MAKGIEYASTDINRVFPDKVCINLDRRPERWAYMQEEFARHNINSVRRLSAVDGQELVVPAHWSESHGAYGCLLSHLQAVRDARERGLSNILIFEDDVAFDADFQDTFARNIRQLPSDWDMLFLGAFLRYDPLPVSQYVHRISEADSTFAYALNHTVFDAFIATNSKALTAVDANNHALQKEFNCYCFMPHLAWVQPLYSDAQERFVNHWYIKESLALAGETAGRYLANTQLVIAFCNSARHRSVADDLIQQVRIYSRRLWGTRISIVEQGVVSTIDRSDVPSNCEYHFVNCDGPFDRSTCFNKGVRESDSSKDVFGFFDGGVFLESKDIIGNIAMCHKYDGTTGYERIFELTDDDTTSLLHDEAQSFHWFNPGNYSPKRKWSDLNSCCFLSGRALQESGGWKENQPVELALVRNSLSEEPRLRLFKSPNNAMRLCHKH
ncbi:MAG: glycosyltransferase family 25 protein [Planctomycetota bacterium]